MKFWQAFCDQVQDTPYAMAIEDSVSNRCWTYAELHEAAITLGVRLKAELSAGECVGIALPRSGFWIVSALACWSQNLCWVPVNKATPPAFLKQIRCVLESPEQVTVASGTPVIIDAAYVIFTSGSSGTPKGVYLPHRGLVQMLRAQIKAFNLLQPARVLWVLAPTFDASVSDWGTTLLSGSTLLIVKDPLADIAHFYKQVERTRAEVIDLPPSFLNLLTPAKMPASVKTLVIGGESPHPDCVKRWVECCRLVNVYGPTEAMICTSLQVCGPDWVPGDIGVPLPGVSYRIHKGELWINTPGLATGYWNNAELTQQRFVHKAGQRWFCTRDAVAQVQGRYLFKGRLSRHFKYQGQFFSPEPVETYLKSLFSGRVCVFLYDNTLVACVEASHAEMRHGLKHLKPEPFSFLLPQRWYAVSQWPITAHYKTAENILKQQILQAKVLPFCFENTAHEPSKKALVWLAVFASVLNQKVTLATDFFLSGGTSLQVLAAVNALKAQGIHCSAESFYRHRTVGQIMASAGLDRNSMSAQELRQSTAAFAPLPVNKTAKNGVLITGATGFLGARLLVELLQKYPPEVPFYILVRASDPQHGLSRVLTAIEPYYTKTRPALERLLGPRLRIVIGDLNLPKLGLSSAVYARLYQAITTVYHSAACVSQAKSFGALFAVNVASVVDLLSLGRAFHFVSSLSVLVAQPQLKGYSENDLLSNTQSVVGGYAQSKWAAEAWLQAQKQKTADRHIWIYRPAFILPASDTPTFETVGRKERRKTKPINENGFINLLPLDYVSKAIVHLSTCAPATYHLANKKSLTAKRFSQCLSVQNPLLHFGPLVDASSLFYKKDNELHSRPTLSELESASVFCPDPEVLLLSYPTRGEQKGLKL